MHNAKVSMQDQDCQPDCMALCLASGQTNGLDAREDVMCSVPPAVCGLLTLASLAPGHTFAVKDLLST